MKQDEYGNACPGPDTLCSSGWPFDKDNKPCSTFDRCKNNWSVDASGNACSKYDACAAGGDGGRTFADARQTTLCTKQFFAGCLNQDVTIPIGYYANLQLASEGKLGRLSGKFYRIKFGNEFQIALLNFDEYANYPDLTRPITKSTDGTTYTNDGEKGNLKFIALSTYFKTHSVEFSVC